ncbi:MAG: hypothetical protein U0869_14710 [Chloroflexota bacterium]
MGPVPRLSRLLFAVLAVPMLTGCAALGLPTLPGGSVDPLAADILASPDPAASPLSDTATDIASPDGYALTLPAGWAASDLAGQDTLPLTDALAATDPALGTLARGALDQSGARLSLLAVDAVAAASGTWAPGILVSTMRTRSDKTAARHMVEDLLAQAPLATDVSHSVEGLPAGDAHRYDAVITGDTLDVEVQVYVFRVGGTSYIVGAVAPEDQFAASQPAFDAILKSLRFGL